MSGIRHLHLLALTLSTCFLQACTVTPTSTPRNVPFDEDMMKPRVSAVVNPDSLLDDESIVALSFSGGGLRAAAYAYGVLQGLNELTSSGGKTLLDDVGFITSVSGGSLTAAYFGLHGKQGMQSFRDVVLREGGEGSMRTSLYNPVNIARLLAGGLNDRNTLRSWLDDKVFKQATYADFFRHGRPHVWVNATDLYHRMAFPFHELAFSRLCSDLSQLPIADAVYASMAVPVVFAPLVLETFPERCGKQLPTDMGDPEQALDNPRTPLSIKAIIRSTLALRNNEAQRGRYIRLADGGLTDNFGLSTLQHLRHVSGTLHGPLGRHDAVRMHRLIFIVVDAGQSTESEWNSHIEGPTGLELAAAAIDTAIVASARASYDAFLVMMQLWQNDIIKYRCGISQQEVMSLRDSTQNWLCDDVQFVVTRVAFDDFEPKRAAQLSAIPTRLSLPQTQIEQLIEAGRDSVRVNAIVKAYQQELLKPKLGKPK